MITQKVPGQARGGIFIYIYMYIYNIYSTYIYIYIFKERDREREHENTHIDTFEKLTLNILGLLALTSPDSLSFKLF